MAPRKKALVIHDHPDIVLLVVKRLEKLGFEVIFAVNLQAARLLLESHADIALVIVDGGMPLDENDSGTVHAAKNTVAFLHDVLPSRKDIICFIGFTGIYTKELRDAGCHEVTNDAVVLLGILQKCAARIFAG